MKACSMVERKEIGFLESFLNQCNSCCYNNRDCSYRAETNRKMRHAYAEWFMETLHT